MSAVWVLMLATGCLTALVTGRVEPMVSSVLDGIHQSVELVIGIVGVFCMWMGIERLARESGLVDGLARLVRPLVGVLFPQLSDRKHRVVLGTVTSCVLSNVLGLGSATPLGLRAMTEIKQALGEGRDGLRTMSTLAIISAAGFCIFPSTLIALRASLGSRNPAVIAGPTAVAGLVATFAGLLTARLIERIFHAKP